MKGINKGVSRERVVDDQAQTKGVEEQGHMGTRMANQVDGHINTPVLACVQVVP